MMRSHLLCGLLAMAAVSAAASLRGQNLERYERVLLPISASYAPGAYATLWTTELWFRNNSGRPAEIFPTSVADWTPGVGSTDRLPVFMRPPEEPGQFLFVTRENAADVQFDLRLFNEADRHDGWGTKLPVVRESHFSNVVNLINVPSGSEYRSALRIYGLPDHAPVKETVVVRIYSERERLLASTQLTFDGTLIEVPQYAAILSLRDAFPAIRGVDRVWIEVTSGSGTAKIWAFIAVVSNASQDVALVTPD